MNASLYSAAIDPPWDLGAWRAAARAGLRGAIAPEDIGWSGGEQAGLLGGIELHDAPVVREAPPVPAALFELAESVLCHREPQRHALLYRIAWRIAQGERGLLSRATDIDIDRATRLAKAVNRDHHKMKAFVRFRAVPGEDNAFIAWFEPEHCIVDRVAPFFARRFAGMRWVILTPYRSASWDGERLGFGPGAQRSDAPEDDANEDLWRIYYAHIFNPARLNPRMMRQEMPQKYWKHLPEAHLLPELIRDAGLRVREMAEREHQPTKRRVPARSAPVRNIATPRPTLKPSTQK
jgi:uracil-DNA glycosylase